MKKKIVNVILSVAVVTSMMFAVTACGSKDNDKAPAESAAVTNTVEDAAKADTEDTAKADAEGGMTAEDWVNSEEASTYVNLFNTMFNGAMTTELKQRAIHCLWSSYFQQKHLAQMVVI